jgi:predicted small lipoprotein YifL
MLHSMPGHSCCTVCPDSIGFAALSPYTGDIYPDAHMSHCQTPLLLICLLLVACGQTGPLYLPEPEAAPEAVPEPETAPGQEPDANPAEDP